MKAAAKAKAAEAAGGSDSASGEKSFSSATGRSDEKSLSGQLSKMRTQLNNLAESEAHFTRLAFTKGKELERVRAENDSLLNELEESRTDLAHAREANNSAPRLLKMIEDKDLELSESRDGAASAKAEHAAAMAALQEEVIEAEAEGDARVLALEGKHQREVETLTEKLERMKQQLGEIALGQTANDSVRNETNAAAKARESTLLGTVSSLQKEREALKVDLRRQATAAKALGALYALRIGLMRRQLKQRGESGGGGGSVGQDSSLVHQARIHELKKECERLKGDVDEARGALEPLESAFAQTRAQLRRANAAISEMAQSVRPLQDEASTLRTKLQTAEDQSVGAVGAIRSQLFPLDRSPDALTHPAASDCARTHPSQGYLEAALAKAETAKAHASLRAEKLDRSLGQAKRELRSSAVAVDTLRSEAGVMQSRIGEMEVRFGPLLNRQQQQHGGSVSPHLPPSPHSPSAPPHFGASLGGGKPSPRGMSLQQRLAQSHMHNHAASMLFTSFTSLPGTEDAAVGVADATGSPTRQRPSTQIPQLPMLHSPGRARTSAGGGVSGGGGGGGGRGGEAKQGLSEALQVLHSLQVEKLQDECDMLRKEVASIRGSSLLQPPSTPEPAPESQVVLAT